MYESIRKVRNLYFKSLIETQDEMEDIKQVNRHKVDIDQLKEALKIKVEETSKQFKKILNECKKIKKE